MDDVLPLPLEEDEEFFSDLGNDDVYVYNPSRVERGRLVINTSEPIDNSRYGRRFNPFQPSELRIRSSNTNGVPGDLTGSLSNSDGHTGCGENANISPITDAHCHVPHQHEPDNTVRNQLIAVSIFTTLFMIGEGIGKENFSL